MLANKRLALSVFGVAMVLAAAAAVPALAKGPHGSKGNSVTASGHVTICHATPPDTAANGYVRISPSASGVYHGHLRQHSADIIPPFTYGGVSYSENWDARGQAIWNNGCVAPASTTGTGTTTGTTTTTTTTSSTTTTTGAVASATTTKAGVLGVTKQAHPVRARTGGASFTG